MYVVCIAVEAAEPTSLQSNHGSLVCGDVEVVEWIIGPEIGQITVGLLPDLIICVKIEDVPRRRIILRYLVRDNSIQNMGGTWGGLPSRRQPPK